MLEGDNLHSLKLLQKTHTGKVDVIYIDPPYNTGNTDFVYNDTYVGKTDGYAHSKWLSFMHKRLELALELLSERGVIFISIDDNEQAQLKLLCDSIFGVNNFLCNTIWKSKSGGANDSSSFGVDHEYILVYAKNAARCKIKNDLQAVVTTSYNKTDEDGRKYALDRLDKQSLGYQPTLDFPIIGPDGKEYRVIHKDENNKKARWRWGQETVKQRYDELVFIYPYVYTKNYEKNDGAKPRSILFDERFGRTRTGGTDLKKVIGNQDIFSYPKPINLIKYLLSISAESNSIIVDFFAGSGTTGHAVAQLNKEDGGNRTYILCTNNENNICEEVTYQRLNKIQEDFPHNLRYFKTDFVPKYPEERSLTSQTVQHVRELIELEHQVLIDGLRNTLILKSSTLQEQLEKALPGANVYVGTWIYMDSEEYSLIDEKRLNIIYVPDYYFEAELTEVGEL